MWELSASRAEVQDKTHITAPGDMVQAQKKFRSADIDHTDGFFRGVGGDIFRPGSASTADVVNLNSAPVHAIADADQAEVPCRM